MSLSTIRHGSGSPIVVLPGLGLDAAFTAAVTEPALAHRSGSQRIYVSLPGIGSPPPPEASSDSILEVLTDSLCSEFGGGTFALMGYSYGGYLANALAGRLATQVDRLLLVCSGVKIAPGERDLSGVLPPETEPGWLDACPEQLHEHLAHAVGRQHREVGARLASAFDGATQSDDTFIADLSERYQLTGEERLMPFEQPVTFVAGRRDRIAGFRDQFAAAQSCPLASYFLVAQAGHYLPAEVPSAFAAAVTNWLS